MYRRSCNNYIYKWVVGKKWVKVSNKKAWRISASEDSLWMIDYPEQIPFKFDQATNKFEQKGDLAARWISAGINGEAFIVDYESKKPHIWRQNTATWTPLSDTYPTMVGLTTSKGGRMYAVDWETDKAFK